MENKIKKSIKKSIKTKELVIKNCLKTIKNVALICIKTLKSNGKILFCGNGGSAADSQHLAAELVVRFKKDRKAFKAISLTTDTSILTSTSNDYNFNKIFSRQIEALANKNDTLIAFSTSGKSKNIIEAVKKSKAMKLKVIGFTSTKGKKFAKMCDIAIIVPSTDTAHIQESHICIGHIVCDLIEEALSK